MAPGMWGAVGEQERYRVRGPSGRTVEGEKGAPGEGNTAEEGARALGLSV